MQSDSARVITKSGHRVIVVPKPRPPPVVNDQPIFAAEIDDARQRLRIELLFRVAVLHEFHTDQQPFAPGRRRIPFNDLLGAAKRPAISRSRRACMDQPSIF